MYSSEALSTYSKLYNRDHYLVPEHCRTPKGDFMSIKQSILSDIIMSTLALFGYHMDEISFF